MDYTKYKLFSFFLTNVSNPLSLLGFITDPKKQLISSLLFFSTIPVCELIDSTIPSAQNKRFKTYPSIVLHLIISLLMILLGFVGQGIDYILLALSVYCTETSLRAVM